MHDTGPGRKTDVARGRNLEHDRPTFTGRRRADPAEGSDKALQIYLPIAEMPISVFLILGMGAAVGFVSGLFGIGGGFLMTPLLIFLGIPPAVAVATQSAQIAASSTTGALAALRRGAIDFKLAGVLTAGGFVGTAIGVWTFAAMRRAGQLELFIVISYVSLFTAIGSLMVAESLREFWSARRGVVRPLRRAGEHATFMGWPVRMRFPRSRLYASILPIVGIAFVIGFLGTLLGIGGGFILVPTLLYVFRVPTAVVIGTSQVQVLCTALLGTVLQAAANGAVDIVLALILIVGGVFGAQFGGRAGRAMRADIFRLLLGILVLSVGLRFAVEMVVRPVEPFSIYVPDGRR